MPDDLSRRGLALILLAAAGYSSFSLWANNPLEFPHPWRLFPIVGAVWLPSFVLAVLARRLGATGWAAAAGGIVWALTLSLGGPIVVRVGVATTLLGGFALAALIAVLMTRVADRPSLRSPVIVLGFVFGIGPLGPLAVDVFDQTGAAELTAPTSSVTSDLTHRPDIYVVVVDGFVGLDGSRTVFGVDDPAWAAGLKREGFQVPASGWSSYPITIAAVPSLFDMDYPVPAGADGNRALISSLIDKLGGDNRLVSILNANDYETTMIEAGWSWSHCGPGYDQCVPSGFFDEGTFRVVQRSIAGPWVVRQLGSAFTQGAKHAIESLLDETERSGGNESGPRFVFGHVMAPHPPMFLNAECEVIYERGRAGVRIPSTNTDLEQRKRFYLEQTECVTGFMIDFASRVDVDDVVVFVADHGSDSQNQLIRPGSDWSKNDSIERLSVLVAVRAGTPCNLGETVLLPNLMRTILDCVDGNPPSKPVEKRMFVGGLRIGTDVQHFVELSPGDIAAIVGAGGQ